MNSPIFLCQLLASSQDLVVCYPNLIVDRIPYHANSDHENNWLALCENKLKASYSKIQDSCLQMMLESPLILESVSIIKYFNLLYYNYIKLNYIILYHFIFY